MQPGAPEHLYGPYPFVGTPTLGQPKVDAHRAGLEFHGKATDPTLPPKGGIILTREDKDPKEPWKIRSIIWYEELPVGVRMPKTSVTRADVAQEPRVRRAVESYLRAWREKDWARMKVLTFDWLSAKVEQPHRAQAAFRGVAVDADARRRGEGGLHGQRGLQGALRVGPQDGERAPLLRLRERVWKVRGGAFML